MDDRQYGMPFPGPIEELRLSAVSDSMARDMLRHALTGVALGGVDRDVLDYLASTDTRVTVVVASLIRRAWSAGVDVGRAEPLDESAAIAAEGYSPGPDYLADVAGVAVARYRAIVARDDADAYEARQLAVVVSIETAVTLLDSDAELAAAVRAVVAADQERDAETLASLTDQLRPEITLPDDVPDVRPVRCTRCRHLTEGPVTIVQPARFPICQGCTRAHQICQACGDPAGGVDPLYAGRAGVWVHRSHLLNPDHGQYAPGLAAEVEPCRMVGGCGHRIADSEWRAGFRTCERCADPDQDGDDPTGEGAACREDDLRDPDTDPDDDDQDDDAEGYDQAGHPGMFDDAEGCDEDEQGDDLTGGVR